MAKYRVRHTCGHDFVHDLHFSRQENDRLAYAKEQGMCPYCFRQFNIENRRAVNARSAELERNRGFSPLIGTDNAIEWGRTCRQDLYDTLCRRYVDRSMWMAVRKVMDLERDARYWIGNRDRHPLLVYNKIVDRYPTEYRELKRRYGIDIRIQGMDMVA